VQTVVASGQYEFGDLVRAVRNLRHNRRWLWYPQVVLGLLVLAFGLVVLILAPATYHDTLPLIGLGLLLGSLLWWEPYATASLQWNNSLVRGQQEFQLNEDGVVRKGENSRSEMKWAAFVFWREDSHQFYLFTGKGSVYFVPKRFFDGAESVELCRQLIASRVPSKS
jgi:hypothetical protein